jgi:YesN/AraC family two-component response regulator
MDQLSLQWLDLTVSTHEARLPGFFYKHGNVLHCRDYSTLRSRLANLTVDAVIFDFDYPTKPDLDSASRLKQEFPGTPMLMLTVQHSEALAVWAFRSKLLDYFVKPMAAAEVEECTNRLREITLLRKEQPSRKTAKPNDDLPTEASGHRAEDHRALTPSINFVEKHFHSRVRNEDVASQCGMNPFYFSKRFKETFEIGFHEYLTRFRLREARRLLVNPNTSVTEVCHAVGFNDASYFTRVFKKYFGGLPSNYLGLPMTREFTSEITANYDPVPIAHS